MRLGKATLVNSLRLGKNNAIMFLRRGLKAENPYNQNEKPEMDKYNQHWNMLGYDIIFEKIMLMVGLESLDSLDSCRQVCRSWNAMIMNRIWEKPTKKWGIIIQRRIERSWDDYYFYHCSYPSHKKISQAKFLGI